MSEILHRRDDFLGESYDTFRHESGLEVYVVPKKLATSYAVLATRYGSFDNVFGVDGEAPRAVPAGIAHFLEHKLFDNSDGTDTFERFALHGASSNAYTTFDHTAYLFSSTEDHADCLAELLRFVYDPYFTEASVKKERGIIAEEIKMGLDSPSRERFWMLSRLLYPDHPIAVDIAGTVDSIAGIDADLLYRCYNTFYAPSNMVLAVAGAFTTDEVRALCDRLVPKNKNPQIARVMPPVGREVAVRRAVKRMRVSRPLFAIGFKDDAAGIDGTALLRRSLTLSVVVDCLFGETSPFFSAMLETNMADGLGASTMSFPGLQYAYLVGAADEPEAVYDRALATIAEAKKNGIDREAFARVKRGMVADLVRVFNATEEIGELILDCALWHCEPSAYADVLRAITPEDADRVLSELFDERYAAMAVIECDGTADEITEDEETEE